MMRAWLAGVLALSGCYLQPTVFERERAPLLERSPTPPPPDPPVGCITLEPGYRRRSAGKWWLGSRRVSRDQVDHALDSSPLSAPLMARVRRDQHLALGLFFAGLALTVGSLAGMIAWIHADERSSEPLVLLAPAFASYALGIAAAPVSIRGDNQRRRAIDTYNSAAAEENRCPP
jgi:hypothetical protein